MGNPGLCVFVVDQKFSIKIWTHVHHVLCFNWCYKGIGILMWQYIMWFRNYILLQIRFRYWSFLGRKMSVQGKLNFCKSISNLIQHFKYGGFWEGFHLVLIFFGLVPVFLEEIPINMDTFPPNVFIYLGELTFLKENILCKINFLNVCGFGACFVSSFICKRWANVAWTCVLNKGQQVATLSQRKKWERINLSKSLYLVETDTICWSYFQTYSPQGHGISQSFNWSHKVNHIYNPSL